MMYLYYTVFAIKESTQLLNTKCKCWETECDNFKKIVSLLDFTFVCQTHFSTKCLWKKIKFLGITIKKLIYNRFLIDNSKDY